MLKKQAMLQINIAKAFDQVSHELLLNMKHVGSVLKGVRMAYSGCSTNVVKQDESTPVQVEHAVCQGCPLSPLLLCFYIEAFF